jgi:hypothetical protein
MTPSLKHIIGIIGTGLTTILAIWFGPAVPANPDLAAQIAQTLIVALALFLPAAKMSVVEKCFTAVAGTLATVLFFVAAKIPSGSAWATVVPVIVAVVTDLKTAWNDGDLGQGLRPNITINPLGGGKTACFVALALGSLFVASPARAQAPNVVAPPISFCIGATATCVMPDFNLQTINYDLDAKKWSGGVTAIAVGYELLFFSDQPWASGVALHGAVQFNQQAPSFLALTPTLVILKYFELGATISFLDGSIGKAVTAGIGIPFDVVTGEPMYVRIAAQRASASQSQQ